MTLKEADKIVHIWGTYLEYIGGKLNLIFCACIPESFLPFPKNTLKEALNMVAKHYHDMGMQDEVKLIQGSMGYLLGYKDDEEAISQMAISFNDPEWRKAILPVFKDFQNDWIEKQGDFQK